MHAASVEDKGEAPISEREGRRGGSGEVQSTMVGRRKVGLPNGPYCYVDPDSGAVELGDEPSEDSVSTPDVERWTLRDISGSEESRQRLRWLGRIPVKRIQAAAGPVGLPPPSVRVHPFVHGPGSTIGSGRIE